MAGGSRGLFREFMIGVRNAISGYRSRCRPRRNCERTPTLPLGHGGGKRIFLGQESPYFLFFGATEANLKLGFVIRGQESQTNMCQSRHAAYVAEVREREHGSIRRLADR